MERIIPLEQRTYKKAILAFTVLFIAWVLAYYEIILELPQTYWEYRYNRYCILALALALILVLTKKYDLSRTSFTTSQLGLFVLFVFNIFYTYFTLEENLFLQQASVIMMLPAMVLTVIGRDATTVLTLPLLLVICAIPVGEIISITLPKEFINLLEGYWLKPQSGINFYQGIIISGGDTLEFRSVVKTLLLTPSFFIVSIFVSRFIFRHLLLQLFFGSLVIILPSLLGLLFLGAYVSSSILSKILSIYNLEFFIRGFTIGGIVLAYVATLSAKNLILKPKPEEDEPDEYISDFLELHWLRPVTIAYCIFFIVPWVGGIYQDVLNIRSSKEILLLPPKIPGWEGPFNVAAETWYPHYPYSRASFVKAYQKKTLRVQLFTAYVGRQMPEGSLLNPDNRLYIENKWNRVATNYMKVDIRGYKNLDIRETILEYAGRTKIMWSWYYIGKTAEATPSVVNLLDNVSYITRGYRHSGVIAVAMDYPGEIEFGRRDLTRFLNSLHPYLPKIMDPTKKKALDFSIR